MSIIRPIEEYKKIIREELTSGDEKIPELTNTILEQIRDRAYDSVADKILTIPDLATLKQSHFNVVNKNAGVSWGFNSLWALVGTPVPATTENVLLDISGSGKCFYVRFMTEYDNMECRIVMDEIRVSAMARERPYYIYTRLGSVGRDGFTELTMYDTTDNKYMIYYNLAQFDMHLFQNSLRISVYNPDTVDHRVCIICDYALLSSPEVFVRDVDIPFESANIRLALTKLTNLKLSAFTVDIHYEWDEKLNRNVKVLSIMNHTGKEDTTNKIINFIVRNYKVRKDRIRVREY